jgi:hypothetical protein
MPESVRKLPAFPRHQLLDTPLFRAQARELDLLARLGPPTQASEPLDADPCFYWDLVWGCGLVTAIQFHQLNEMLILHIDGDEVDHALRHLDIALRSTELLERVDPALFAQAVPERADRHWELWRREGDESIRVAWDLTERDAHCWCDEENKKARVALHSVRRTDEP